MELQDLFELLAEDPSDDKARSKLATIYFNQGDWQKASKQYSLIKQQRALDNVEAALFAQCMNNTEIGEVGEGVSETPSNADQSLEVKSVASPLSLIVENVVPIRSAQEGDIKFSDIGGLDSVKKTLSLQIIEPFKNPEIFRKYGKKAGGGVLLYGPPGCGKTMLARAIATECNAHFIPVGISDILNQYVGGSEQNLSAIFDKARANRPSVLFFDELDALAFARSKSQSDYTRTLVNEFLNQLDGIGHDNSDILFLAASNMPWDVDSAMKRPGRFSKLTFIPPPDSAARLHILGLKLKDLPTSNLDLGAISGRLAHFSGADIDGFVEQLRELTVERYIESGREHELSQKDVDRVLKKYCASTEDWLATARNIVKYAGSDKTYQSVEFYLKANKML